MRKWLLGRERLPEWMLRLTAAVATETPWAVGSDVAVVAVVLVRNAQAIMAAVSALGVVAAVAAVASFVFLIALAVEASVAVVVVTLNCVYKAWTSLSKELITSL